MTRGSSHPQPVQQSTQTEYPLSEALLTLRNLAPKLGEAELRVLLHLVPIACTPPHYSTAISLRDLASQTKLAFSATRRAVDSLNKRGLIATRRGTPKRPTSFRIQFLDVAKMPAVGVPLKGTPPADGCALSRHTSSPSEAHPECLFEAQHVPFPGTPPTENKRLPPGAAGVDIDSEAIGVIDRLLKARKTDFDPERLEKARGWLHGYVCKFAADKDRHPPDARITAQFLAVAPWPQLEGLLYDLMSEQKEPGYSYAWFVSVALQRIHGIQPKALKQRRAHLKLMKRSPEYKNFTGELLAGAVAGVKGMK